MRSMQDQRCDHTQKIWKQDNMTNCVIVRFCVSNKGKNKIQQQNFFIVV